MECTKHFLVKSKSHPCRVYRQAVLGPIPLVQPESSPLSPSAPSRLGSTCRTKSPQHHMRSTQAAELTLHGPHGVVARARGMEQLFGPLRYSARGSHIHIHTHTTSHAYRRQCSGARETDELHGVHFELVVPVCVCSANNHSLYVCMYMVT